MKAALVQQWNTDDTDWMDFYFCEAEKPPPSDEQA